ncbi:MAG: DUF427 domain-containing protein [Acidimicrobiia bacterium]
MSQAEPESVWDYPRPPRVEPSAEHVAVHLGGLVIAESHRALRVLETSHPPVYYLPPDDVAAGILAPEPRRSFCEFKGLAVYWSAQAGDRRVAEAAWSYPHPAPGYEDLAGCVAFYPGRVDGCFVDGEPVAAQPGDFYGGWITSRIRGPFKGGPGTSGW